MLSLPGEPNMTISPSLVLVPIIGCRAYERVRAIKTLGYLPNIRRPRTFNEMLMHRKFVKPLPNSAMLADKWQVREFVRSRLGSHLLNDVLCVTDDPDKIEFDGLPNAFVIKMNNASSRTLLIFDKDKTDIASVREKLRHWLAQPFGYLSGETFYLDIKPLILVERLIGDGIHSPDDYKFHVFHGRVAYVEVHEDRFNADQSKHTARFYDRDWKPQDFTNGEPLGPIAPRPPTFATMVAAAECLAADIDYIRVDLYSTDERVIFGELTLVPAYGHAPFSPRDVDFHFGALWRIQAKETAR